MQRQGTPTPPPTPPPENNEGAAVSHFSPPPEQLPAQTTAYEPPGTSQHPSQAVGQVGWRHRLSPPQDHRHLQHPSAVTLSTGPPHRDGNPNISIWRRAHPQPHDSDMLPQNGASGIYRPPRNGARGRWRQRVEEDPVEAAHRRLMEEVASFESGPGQL